MTDGRRVGAAASHKRRLVGRRQGILPVRRGEMEYGDGDEECDFASCDEWYIQVFVNCLCTQVARSRCGVELQMVRVMTASGYGPDSFSLRLCGRSAEWRFANMD